MIGTPKTNEQGKDKYKELKLVNFALELGFTIAIPIVLLALLGRLLDRWWGTSPWLLLIGIFVSMIVSIALIYKKTKDVLR
ncbi:MAG TPA: AtpZ/AtpI family protein [Candidatus Paceibacterota bacterium]